jgi:murein DD-endopeptidase MepM/ murein hydrolase activator NlpD
MFGRLSLLFIRVPVLVGILALTVGAPAAAEPCWRPPVTGVVTDPFREPPCPYCAGNRGLEYRVGWRVAVRAVASGTVSWAGSIAGTRYVVVRHVDGWRATYGRLDAALLETGDVVRAGAAVGVASGRLFFGLRQGDRYIDPAPFLAELRGRPRLVPIDGRPARPAPPPRWLCGT